MGIIFNQEKKIFQLDTPESTYLIGIMDQENWVVHLYFGSKINDFDVSYITRAYGTVRMPSEQNGERLRFYDNFPMEYPTGGMGDFRDGCFNAQKRQGYEYMKLSYVSHEIFPGKKKLCQLPATFADDKECTTLEIVCKDNVEETQVILCYSVFEKMNVITRNVRIENQSKEPLYLNKVLSMCIDMDYEEQDFITLDGLWAKERMITRRKLTNGKQSVGSNCGVSSHQANPFIAVVEKGATQENGNVYGFNLVYSGNFIAQAEVSQLELLRITMGISQEHFCWRLNPGEIFDAPEVVMVFSNQGIGNMTRTFHDLYRRHLIRGKYANQSRPVLINNWEATYFDFDEEKIYSIAEEAAKNKIEMLVLDDGWFGERNDDTCGLGDWYVNENKLKGGLKSLVKRINDLGMKFGLWFEPEMISPNSQLYRKHPDWAIAIPGREPALGRKQLVLDITRKEVRENIYAQMYAVLKSANIEYVKWDMNRHLSDLGSIGLEADCQGELSHRYVLALYELQERLITDFPNLLLENCSSGGGRYDPGMLYYSPQIWCSDNTDAIERLRIQEGTAFIYPLSSMGAHIADCPSHSNGRTTPFSTRAYIALMGTFGYELDVTKIPQCERDEIQGQIEMYHQFNQLVQTGDYYRIASLSENHEHDCTMVVSKDQSEALIVYIQVDARSIKRSAKIKLKGLDAETQYAIEGTEMVLCGSTLMNVGVLMDGLWGEYKGKIMHLNKVS